MHEAAGIMHSESMAVSSSVQRRESSPGQGITSGGSAGGGTATREHAAREFGGFDAQSAALAPGGAIQMRRAPGAEPEPAASRDGATRGGAADGAPDADTEAAPGAGPRVLTDLERDIMRMVVEQLEQAAQHYANAPAACGPAGGIAAQQLRAQKAKWEDALKQKGDWERLADLTEDNTPESIVRDIIFFDANDIWMDSLRVLQQRVPERVATLDAKLRLIRSALEQIVASREYASDVATGIRYLELVELAGAAANIFAMGAIREATDIPSDLAPWLNEAGGAASGSSLMQQLVDTGIVDRLALRKAGGECMGDPSMDTRDCLTVASGDLKGLVAQAIRLERQVSRDVNLLRLMVEHGANGPGDVVACAGR